MRTSNIPADVLWEATPSSSRKFQETFNYGHPAWHCACVAQPETLSHSNVNSEGKYTHTRILRCGHIHKRLGLIHLGSVPAEIPTNCLLSTSPELLWFPVPSTMVLSFYELTHSILILFVFWLQLAKVDFLITKNPM